MIVFVPLDPAPGSADGRPSISGASRGNRNGASRRSFLHIVVLEKAIAHGNVPVSVIDGDGIRSCLIICTSPPHARTASLQSRHARPPACQPPLQASQFFNEDSSAGPALCRVMLAGSDAPVLHLLGGRGIKVSIDACSGGNRRADGRTGGGMQRNRRSAGRQISACGPVEMADLVLRGTRHEPCLFTITRTGMVEGTSR